MNKISPKWIALCTATIGLAYTAGYVVTEPKAEATIQSPKPEKQPQNSVQVQASKKARISAQTKHTQKTDKQTGYQDGTYSGQGTNHFGTVAVSVTIKQGKIASVEITNCTTSYSQSYIDHLPSEVVARQSANVDNVSGATNSTEDFKTAIMDAISKAKIS